MGKADRYKKDLDKLVKYGMYLELGLYSENSEYFKDYFSKLTKEQLEKCKKVPFSENYENWYSEALRVIKQLLPDRLEDFTLLYKDPKRKNISYESYGVRDYLIGLSIKDTFGNEKVKPSWCVGKFRNQLKILASIEKRFESSLFDIKALTQADVFDSEIESARELCKRGFYRAAGAICGVVLEKHLKQVAESNGLSLRKKNPAINDYNQLLKDNDIIDTSTWRYIQRLGDLRNLCDHAKDKEPTKDDVLDLLDGTDKMIKEI